MATALAPVSMVIQGTSRPGGGRARPPARAARAGQAGVTVLLTLGGGPGARRRPAIDPPGRSTTGAGPAVVGAAPILAAGRADRSIRNEVRSAHALDLDQPRARIVLAASPAGRPRCGSDRSHAPRAGSRGSPSRPDVVDELADPGSRRRSARCGCRSGSGTGPEVC